MNKEETVKDTSEKLLMQVVEYIAKTGIDKEKERELLIELACSLVTASVDMSKNMDSIFHDINETCLEMRNICFAGTFRFKAGDETRVKRIWRDKNE